MPWEEFTKFKCVKEKGECEKEKEMKKETRGQRIENHKSVFLFFLQHQIHKKNVTFSVPLLRGTAKGKKSTDKKGL